MQIGVDTVSAGTQGRHDHCGAEEDGRSGSAPADFRPGENTPWYSQPPVDFGCVRDGPRCRWESVLAAPCRLRGTAGGKNRGLGISTRSPL